ncbi:MAG: aspartate--tRNA(Asn) ligase [Myxococcota bacterium]
MSEQRIRTTQVREFAGEQVSVAGWIHTIRRLSRVAFVVLRDGWGTVQIAVGPETLEMLKRARAGPESVVRVKATAVADARAPGGVELNEATFEVIVAVAEPLPVALGPAVHKARLPTALDHAPTTLREPSRRAALRVAAAATAGFRATLGGLGFTEINTPRIVAAATEGGANVFEVQYFDTRAYLAQSPQLYKQMMVGVLERVFEVGAVFRAEPHATVRHLAEYVSLDVEFGFIESYLEVAAMVGEVLRGMLRHIEAAVPEALHTTEAVLPTIPEVLPHVSFAEARRMLHAASQGPEHAQDLAPGEERWLGAWAKEHHRSDVLVVTGYPMAKRPFYTHPSAEDPAVSNSFDVLFRGTELVTGGQRLHRHGDVVDALARAGQEPAAFAGYLEAFRFGMPPHGGFAIGLERFVAQLLGLANVRLARAFPRDAHRTQP